MSRIGIMGGTFNPIHIGHLMLAEQALESAHLDQVWMIPTGCSYLKTKEALQFCPEQNAMIWYNLLSQIMTDSAAWTLR